MISTCTSLEQSKKLLELGIDVLSHDMYYEKVMHNITDSWTWELFCGTNRSVITNSFSYEHGVVVPAWSIGALMSVVPFEVNLHGFYTEHGKVYRAESFERVSSKTFEDPVYAMVDLVVWLLENDYRTDFV